jgi:hypothetical protein
LKRPDKKTLLTVCATLLAWLLMGWILISLRSSTGEGQLESSTRLLQILCAGASLLLLMSCIVLAIGLLQIARDAESEHAFPPSSAKQFKILGAAQGEQAWLIAARLRGWAALAAALGMIVAGIGLSIALRAAAAHLTLPAGVEAPVSTAPGLIAQL